MKKLVIGLGASLVVISIVAGNLWRELYEVRLQSTQLGKRVDALQSGQLAANLRPGTLAATAAPAAIKTTAVAATPAGDGGKKAASALLEGMSQLLASPEGREMMLSQARMQMPQQYPDLGRELGLTPAEVDKFFDMLARQQADMSTDALDQINGETQDRAALQERQRRMQERQQANQAELTAMLGSKYPKYQEYQKSLPVRRQVNQLQATLGTGNTALSDAQSRPLITALAAEQTRIQEDRRNAPRGAAGNQQNMLEVELQRTAESNQRLIRVAASYLDPQQLNGYRRMLEQEEALTRSMMRSMAPN